MTSTYCSRQWFSAHIQKLFYTWLSKVRQFPENERYHVSYLSILVANIFFSNYFLLFSRSFRHKVKYYDIFIRKTCPCNVYPLKPHFYTVKLGYAGVYLFFLFLLQNIDCGYSLEPPRRGGSNVYPQSMF